MSVSKEEFVELLDQTIEYAEKGLRAKASRGLRSINAISLEQPRLLWDSPEVHKQGKAFIVMYHFDIFDSEEENIIIAQKAYVYTQRGIELHGTTSPHSFNIFKNLAIVLKLCQDCFVDVVSLFYQKHGTNLTEEALKGSQLLASRVLPYVLYQVLLEMTDAFDGFNNDSFLEDVCQELESEFPSISDKLVKEASNIRKLLHLHLSASLIDS